MSIVLSLLSFFLLLTLFTSIIMIIDFTFIIINFVLMNIIMIMCVGGCGSG